MDFNNQVNDITYQRPSYKRENSSFLPLHLFLVSDMETGLNIKKSCSYSHLSLPLTPTEASTLESSEVPRSWRGGRSLEWWWRKRE